MPTYNLKITVPQSLDKVIAAPLVLCRWLWYGYTFRRIRLNCGHHAIVDVKNYERFSKYNWGSRKSRYSRYALRRVRDGSGRQKIIYMHHCVIGRPKGFHIDHKDGNTLDNREANLRLATFSQNMRNRGKFRMKCQSKYKGIWHCERGWRVSIRAGGSQMIIGHFQSEAEAARAYDAAAKKYHGEFAYLNFPERKIRGLKDLLFLIYNLLMDWNPSEESPFQRFLNK